MPNVISAFTRFGFSLLLALFLPGCGGPEEIDFLYGSFSGDGKLFSYSRVKDDIASIYIANSTGEVLKVINDGANNNYQGAFLDGAFYYVEYSDDAKNSTIMKCDAEASNCYKIYSSTGSVKCLFSYRNRLHFYQSSYVAATHGDSGYARYKIKSVTYDGNEETIHFRREFAYLRCPVVVDNKAYASLTFPDEPTFQIEGDKIISREDYTLTGEGDTYSITRELVDINRSMFLLQYIRKNISYAAITYDGHI